MHIAGLGTLGLYCYDWGGGRLWCLMQVSMKCPTPPSRDRVGIRTSFAKKLRPRGGGFSHCVHVIHTSLGGSAWRKIKFYCALLNEGIDVPPGGLGLYRGIHLKIWPWGCVFNHRFWQIPTHTREGGSGAFR